MNNNADSQSKETTYNTDCCFYFSYSGIKYSESVSVIISNHSLKTISELKDFRAVVYFFDEIDHNRRMTIYCESIKFEPALKVWQTVEIESLSFITSKNWSADSWNTRVEYVKSYCEDITYEVVYTDK